MVAVHAALVITVLVFSASHVADADAQETCELNPYLPQCESNEKEGNALVQRGASKFGPFAPSNPFTAANPFYKPTGVSVADTMLGFNMPDKAECGDFLSKMMETLKNSGGSVLGSSSDPAAAVQQVMSDLFRGNGADFSKSLGCLKYALVYGDKHYIPEECVTEQGELDPSCCMQEKRCSTTNPADGCPWTTFGVNAPSVTCVGSHELSPVAMGVCKCKQPGARCGSQGQGCL